MQSVWVNWQTRQTRPPEIKYIGLKYTYYRSVSVRARHQSLMIKWNMSLSEILQQRGSQPRWARAGPWWERCQFKPPDWQVEKPQLGTSGAEKLISIKRNVTSLEGSIRESQYHREYCYTAQRGFCLGSLVPNAISPHPECTKDTLLMGGVSGTGWSTQLNVKDSLVFLCKASTQEVKLRIQNTMSVCGWVSGKPGMFSCLIFMFFSM